MEAVWRRIFILIVIGVLVTLLVFPVVRGEEDPKDENRISTAFMEGTSGSIKWNDTIDEKLMIYEDFLDEYFFEMILIEFDRTGSIGHPVTNVPIWLNITMGPYTNSSMNFSGPDGSVKFHFDRRLTDTDTGNTFTIPSELDECNTTLRFEFMGTNVHRGTSFTRHCIYSRGFPSVYRGDDHMIDGWERDLLTIMIVNFHSSGIAIILSMFVLPIVGFSIYIKKNIK